MLEQLEDRIVPANTWHVNVTTDNGGAKGVGNGDTGDLRYCVANAQTGDTIDFKAALNGQTILLNNRILLTKGVTIIGQDLTNPNKPVPVNITISGQNKARIFEASK
jgi:hypothetical protein